MSHWMRGWPQLGNDSRMSRDHVRPCLERRSKMVFAALRSHQAAGVKIAGHPPVVKDTHSNDDFPIGALLTGQQIETSDPDSVTAMEPQNVLSLSGTRKPTGLHLRWKPRARVAGEKLAGYENLLKLYADNLAMDAMLESENERVNAILDQTFGDGWVPSPRKHESPNARSTL
jgi:hypothetical protein